MTTSSIARYLRLGETFERPAAPTEIAPGELGESGGAVARYLKLDRHERPAKVRPVAEQRVVKPKRAERVRHEAPKARRSQPRRGPAKPSKVQCPDCDAMVSPTWGQCPNCALILDIAA